MRLPCLLVWSGLLLSCVPGKQPFQAPKTKQGNANAQPLGSDAIPDPTTQTPPPDDPEEEEKAMEPAVIGGAYLYCDADQAKPGDENKPMLVGCRVGNVAEMDWVTASKSATVTNIADGSPAECAISIPLPGSPYHIVFDANRSLQNTVELHLDITLPQGALSMTTTVNPGATKAIEQRLGKGLALYASTGAAGDWPGVDRKSWNIWMPLKIPRAITSFGGDSSGPGPGGNSGKGTAELSFDDTVCTYKPKDAKATEYTFVSCSKAWLPDQWVRSKSLSLRVFSSEGTGPKTELTAGVVLQTEP